MCHSSRVYGNTSNSTKTKINNKLETAIFKGEFMGALIFGVGSLRAPAASALRVCEFCVISGGIKLPHITTRHLQRPPDLRVNVAFLVL